MIICCIDRRLSLICVVFFYLFFHESFFFFSALYTSTLPANYLRDRTLLYDCVSSVGFLHSHLDYPPFLRA